MTSIVHPPKCSNFELTNDALLRLIRRSYYAAGFVRDLSARPPSLLAAQLPYDDLLKSLEEFAGRLYGCAFRSAEGREAPRGHVLQRRILLPVEFLFTGFCHDRAIFSTRCETRYCLPPTDAGTCLCPSGGWRAHCS